MSKEAKLVELYRTLPARSLRTLLEHTIVKRDDTGRPLPGTNDLARAHEVLSAWLKEAEIKLGVDTSGQDGQNEIHRVQAMIGTCPVCDQNDGVVVVKGEPWAVCHDHAVRWKAEKDFLDYRYEHGFSVVITDKPAILWYDEIDLNYANCLAPARIGSAWEKLESAFHWCRIWSVFAATLPIDLFRAVVISARAPSGSRN